MSRNAGAVGALVLTGGLLWLVTAWPTEEDHDRSEVAVDEAPAPPPAAAVPVPVVPATPAAPPAPPPAPAPAPLAPDAPEPPPLVQPRVPKDDIFDREQGPVAELKKAYESEPRDSAASEIESKIREAFDHPDGSPDLFKSVLCRESVCKLELRWATGRLGAYVAGITRAMVHAKAPLGVSPTGLDSGDSTKIIEVYVTRKPPNEPSPAAALLGAQSAPGTEPQPALPAPVPTPAEPAPAAAPTPTPN
jgi:hypothetical protein